jgi:hypothetical protein
MTANKKKRVRFMDTTTVSVEKTSSEITQVLMQLGATDILMTCCEVTRSISGIAFTIREGGRKVPIKVPIQTGAIFDRLNKKRPRSTKHKMEERDQEQAERVAWRIALHWIKANLAIIEDAGYKPLQMFLGHVQTDADGQTFYEKLESRAFQTLLPEHTTTTAGGAKKGEVLL